MSKNDPMIDRKLGDYVIQDLLGHGGMARVYRGYDANLDRYAAVKVIDAHLVTGEDADEYRERFQREARSIARLRHPRIVGVYQFGEVDVESYYMAMAFIEGKDLRFVLKEFADRNRRLPNSRIFTIIRDVALGLDHAHQNEVIHRDVKPSNIMVTADGHAVLTDFGLALSISEGTAGNIFGSVHYIAPEQAVSSANVKSQSDLYSLGVVLYEMLTGQVPFDDQSVMSVALKHMQDPPPPLRSINPDISEEVEKIVMRVLEKEPEKRFVTGLEMVRTLQKAFGISDEEAALEAESSPARPGGKRATGQTPAAPDDSPTITDSSVPSGMKRPQLADSDTNRTIMIVGAVIAAIVIVIILAVVLAPGNGDGAAETQTIVAAAATSNGAGQLTETADAEATALAAATEEATDTPEPQPTDTDEPQPTDTDEPQPTDTEEPQPTDTDEPAATRTPRPSNTPEATDTPTASNTPRPTQNLTATAVAFLEANAPVVLIYDDTNIVLFNRSDTVVNVSGLTFVRVVNNGADLIFNSDDWADAEGISRSPRRLPSEDCFQLWTTAFVLLDAPDYCGTRHSWRQVPFTRWFWLSTDDDDEFEVRRGEIVLARCPVNEGECLIDLRG